MTRSDRVTTIKKPNFSSAYTKANEILVSSNVICTFPFSPKDLVKEKSEIPCRTFAKARSYGVDIEAFGSESAIIIELGGRRIIFYDESKPLTHVKYSILHELGHDQNGTIWVPPIPTLTIVTRLKQIISQHSFLCLSKFFANLQAEV